MCYIAAEYQNLSMNCSHFLLNQLWKKNKLQHYSRLYHQQTNLRSFYLWKLQMISECYFQYIFQGHDQCSLRQGKPFDSYNR